MNNKLETARFCYKATYNSVYDGDTLVINIDCGFHIKLNNIKARLAKVNTPEIRGCSKREKKRGLAAKEYVKEILKEHVQFFIRSYGKGKYGRYVIDIYFTEDCKGKTLSEMIIEHGHGIAYE